MVSFAMSHKVAASIFQQPNQFGRKTLSHDALRMNQSCDAKTPGKQFNLNGITEWQTLLPLIAQACLDGAHLHAACHLIGLSAHTVQRKINKPPMTRPSTPSSS